MDIINLATNFYNSLFFSVVKFIIGIYVIVIFVNIVLLLVQRGLAGNVRETILGMNIPKELARAGGKKKLAARWKKIRERLESNKEADYKLSIIEADYLIEDLIKRLGYAGENMSERLNGIPSGQIEHVEELKRAHEIRNRIIHEDSFVLDRKTAGETLALYEEFLRHFEVLG
jgi:ABC-type lipoprotein release transport system permease subunit